MVSEDRIILLLSKRCTAGIISSNHPIFDATVVIDGIRVGHGQGESKKEAEQCAAHSVSCAMSDEACGDILDKIDRLYQPKGTGVS